MARLDDGVRRDARTRTMIAEAEEPDNREAAECAFRCCEWPA